MSVPGVPSLQGGSFQACLYWSFPLSLCLLLRKVEEGVVVTNDRGHIFPLWRESGLRRGGGVFARMHGGALHVFLSVFLLTRGLVSDSQVFA